MTALFCAFAVLLPIVVVVAPKGTVALLLLAAALAVPTYWWAEKRLPKPDLPISMALALLVVWCAIASAWGDDAVRSLVLALRIAVILAAGTALFAIAATVEEAARRRIGVWLAIGFGLGLVLTTVETAFDYPLLRLFKTADSGREVFWLGRGAVSMALIVWPVTVYLWGRGVGWKALAIPVLLGVASLFVESAAATLGICAGIAAVLLALRHRKLGLVVTIAASVLVFAGMPFAARLMHGHGWHRADWLASSARHRIEIWNFAAERIAEKPLLGWGFNSSRHVGALHPDVGEPGRNVEALHPHSAPLQILLELGAVGAVIALVLLGLVATRLDAVSGRTRALSQALLITALAVGCVSFGLWQNWWLALMFSVSILVPLTAAPAAARNAAMRAVKM